MTFSHSCGARFYRGLDPGLLNLSACSGLPRTFVDGNLAGQTVVQELKRRSSGQSHCGFLRAIPLAPHLIARSSATVKIARSPAGK
jgi:hypothetical protein